jgi:transcriptional regulator with XRE-family HTH domain
MELHDKITTLHKLKRLTQKDMSEKMNISDSAYSKIEQGITQISVERLEKIAQILHMEKQDIENFDEEVVLAGIANNNDTVERNAVGLIFNECAFEKEREAYKTHIIDLQKQVASQTVTITTLQKTIEMLVDK